MKFRCNPWGSAAQLTKLQNTVFAKGKSIMLRKVYHDYQEV